MSDNRKYYYLKLKENYFDDDSIVLLESMQDGVLYSNILLKLYLKSLKHGGRLQLDEDIPYTAQIKRRKAQGLQDRYLYDYTFANDNGQNPLMDKARAYVENWKEACRDSRKAIPAFFKKEKALKYLVIAEKPSVSKSIAKVIGAYRQEDGYLEGGDCVVSWCLGHLAEYAAPEHYDERYENWRFEDLPILPVEWKLLVHNTKKPQFNVLRKLLRSKKFDYVVNACDAG